MKRPNRPAYWQLDLFTVAMIGLMILIMMANLPPPWTTVAEIGWCVLMTVGMGIWIHANRTALMYDERKQRVHERYANERRVPPGAQGGRTIPLTPVQERFLAVLDAKED